MNGIHLKIDLEGNCTTIESMLISAYKLDIRIIDEM